MADASDINCHQCGKQLTTANKFCPGCGTPQTTPIKDERLCNNCKNPVGATDKFCSECGYKIPLETDKCKSVVNDPLTTSSNSNELRQNSDSLIQQPCNNNTLKDEQSLDEKLPGCNDSNSVGSDDDYQEAIDNISDTIFLIQKDSSDEQHPTISDTIFPIQKDSFDEQHPTISDTIFPIQKDSSDEQHPTISDTISPIQKDSFDEQHPTSDNIAAKPIANKKYPKWYQDLKFKKELSKHGQCCLVEFYVIINEKMWNEQPEAYLRFESLQLGEKTCYGPLQVIKRCKGSNIMMHHKLFISKHILKGGIKYKYICINQSVLNGLFHHYEFIEVESSCGIVNRFLHLESFKGTYIGKYFIKSCDIQQWQYKMLANILPEGLVNIQVYCVETCNDIHNIPTK